MKNKDILALQSTTIECPLQWQKLHAKSTADQLINLIRSALHLLSWGNFTTNLLR